MIFLTDCGTDVHAELSQVIDDMMGIWESTTSANHARCYGSDEGVSHTVA